MPKIHFLALLLIFSAFFGKAFSQCVGLPGISSISSRKVLAGKCSPVSANLIYDVTFDSPVTIGTLELVFNWGDGSNPTRIPFAVGTNTYTTAQLHDFPQDSDCEFVVEMIMSYNGVPCPSTRQVQKIPSWRTEAFNGGNVKLISPLTGTTEHLVCEGEDISVIFDDETDFNCNENYVHQAPDPVETPNIETRWQQIVYNTPVVGSKIPNISVDGVPITGAAGIDILSNYQDPRGVWIMTPPVSSGDGRRRPTLLITAPGGFGPNSPKAGDVFEVTLRYWNFCNPYDDPAIPGPPADLINGDNPPVEQSSTIRIISAPSDPTPVPNTACSGASSLPDFQISIPGGRSRVEWFEDNGGVPGNIISNPLGINSLRLPASALGITSSVPGIHSVYVRYYANPSGSGTCASNFVQTTLEIIDNTADAGIDAQLCEDLTYSLNANVPVAPGSGEWSVVNKQNPGATVIFSNVNDPAATVSVSNFGLYVFRWTVTNGICVKTDEIQIDFGTTSVTAFAGTDPPPQCGLTYTLNATTPTIGTGVWSPVAGVTFSDPASPTSSVTVSIPGSFIFTWNVISGVCTPPATDDVAVTFVQPPLAVSLTPEICDDIADDPLEATIDLNDYFDAVTGGQPDRTITWYKNDAPPTGLILSPGDLVQSGVTTGSKFVARVEDNATLCSNDATLEFTVRNLPEAMDSTLLICEDSQGSNHAGNLNLNDAQFTNAVIGTVTDVTVKWFYTELDAVMDVNAITTLVDITGSKTFFARVTANTAPFCNDVAQLNVIVTPQPAPQPVLGKETVCANETQLYQVNPTPGAKYYWTIPNGPGEFAINAGGGVNDFFVVLSFPNVFSATIKLRAEISGCSGTEVDKTISVLPSPQPFQIVRPDLDPDAALLTDEVCSNDVGVSYAVKPNNYSSSTYSWDIIHASDNAPGGAVVANGQTTGNVLVNFTNEDVIIRVRESNASNCFGPEQQLAVAVNQRPVMLDPGKDICSDEATGIVFESSPSSPVIASRYDITGVTVSSGLVPLTGPASGPGQADAIVNDAFENQGNISQIVRYNVVPVSIDGMSGKECPGNQQVVSVSVKPKPVLAPNLDKVTCSEEETGLTFYSAPNSFPADKFIIESIETNGLTPLTPLPPLFTEVNADAVSNAKWENNSTSEVSVIYRVRPYSTLVGCAGNPPVDVSVKVFPKATVDPVNPVTVCGGERLNIPLSSLTPDVNFIWTVKSIEGSVTGATSGTGTVITDLLSNGALTPGKVTYEVRAKNPPEKGDCLGPPLDVEVTVNPFNIDFQIVSPATQCTGSEFVFEWSVEQGVGYTWSWSDDTPPVVFAAGDLPLGTNQVTHVFTTGSSFAPTVYTVQLQANNNVCTSKTLGKPITINPSINLNINPGDTILCSGESIEFKNQSTGVDVSRWYYRKLGTTNIVNERSTDAVTYVLDNTTSENPLIYEVVYEAHNNEGCRADYTKQVAVYRNPAALFDEGVIDPFVAGVSSVTFVNTSSVLDDTQFEYTWDFGDNLASPSTANGLGPFTVDYFSAGSKNVNLKVVNRNARDEEDKICQSIFTEQIMIPLPEVEAIFKARPLAACFPVDIEVENQSPGADTFEWELRGPNNTIVQSTARNPVFTVTRPGTYSLSLKASFAGTGQSDFAEQTGIEVFPRPQANFNARPTTLFVPDTELRTFNLSSQANHYLWDFGDGTKSDEVEPTYFYKLPGNYEITLVAGYDNGLRDLDGDGIVDGSVICYDTARQEVKAIQGGTTQVPNAFTPSKNGPSGGVPGTGGTFNDVFLPITKGVEEFEMQIYDRWGNLIFESHDKNIGWDGYDKGGHLLPAGVYVFKLTLRLSDDQRTTQIGDVTLIR